VPCPQDAGRLALAAVALAVVPRADADGNDLDLIPVSAFNDFALAAETVRASAEGCRLHRDGHGCLLEYSLTWHGAPPSLFTA